MVLSLLEAAGSLRVPDLDAIAEQFERMSSCTAELRADLRGVVGELEAYFRPRLPRLGRGIRLRARIAADFRDRRECLACIVNVANGYPTSRHDPLSCVDPKGC